MTIVYKYQANTSELNEYLHQFNCIIRYAYNRRKDNPDIRLSDIEKLVKLNMNNIQLMDASLIKLAVNESKSITIDKPVIFARSEFMKLKYHKKSANKEKFKNKRANSIFLRGSKSDYKGNRKAELDIENNRILIKMNRFHKLFIPLINLSNKRKSELLHLQKKCEQKEAFFSLEITNDSLNISFDESILSDLVREKEIIKNRILSIDLNPNYIGFVIMDNKKIIHKEIVEIKELNKQDNTKKRHEKYQITNYIKNIAIHYQVEAIIMEELNIPSKDKGIGRGYNRLVNNDWHREIYTKSIQKWCNIYNIRYIGVIAAYTSWIGCLTHNEIDSIAAAIEIGKRGLCVLTGVQYQILPINLDINLLLTRWKKIAISNNISTWKDLILEIKKSKISYRILFGEIKSHFSSRLFSDKSYVYIHKFT